MGLLFTIAAGPRQRSNSRVRVPRDSWPCLTVSNLRLPQPAGSGPHIYIPQQQGGPVIPPGTAFPSRRLLHIAGLRWRHSTPPTHGFTDLANSKLVSVITSRNEQFRKHRSLLYSDRFHGNILGKRYPVAAVYTCLLRICCLAADFVSLFVFEVVTQ
jgi:hypothetical protein